MNKILSIICLLCGLSQLRGADRDLSSSDAYDRRNLNKTEVRGAAFVPTSHRFKEIYGGVLPSIQLEQAKAFEALPELELWGNLEWIFSTGAEAQSCGKSSIDMLNISVGLKGIGSVYRDWVYLYMGIGPDLGFTWIKNQARCCVDCDEGQSSHNCNIGVGGIVKSGCQIFCTSYFYLDFFADYLYLPIKFHNTKDIGGLKAGLGLSGRY